MASKKPSSKLENCQEPIKPMLAKPLKVKSCPAVRCRLGSFLNIVVGGSTFQ